MPYTFQDLAKEVLLKAEGPLTYQEIWDRGKEAGFTNKLRTNGKTPWQTLGARLFVEVRDNPKSEFMKVGSRPKRFFLAKRKASLPKDIVTRLEIAEQKEPKIKKEPAYLERDLHPLLAYYAYATPSFSKGKSIITKTILHEKSKRDGYSEWLHPDMVGFYLPLEDWQPDVLAFSRIADNSVLRLYSFEIKRSITKATYRESFFQAVSNSSWAHEGYLVTANLDSNDDLLAELERLSMAFGIGIIELDLEDIDASRVTFPAHRRDVLDWETMNKLSEQNEDFRKFLQDVRIDFESKRIHKSEYDPILSAPDEHLAKFFPKK